MSIDDEKLNALISQIYEAALDDTLWPPLIHELAKLIHATDSLLFSLQIAENNQPRILFTLSNFVNIDNNAWNAYTSYYWQYDVWTNWAAKQGLLQYGTVMQSDKFIERNAFRQTEYYCDFAKPMLGGIDTAMCATLFDASTTEQSPPLNLSFYKSTFAEAFTQQDERLVRYLLPHMQRALRIRWKMAEERQAHQLKEQALEHIAAAVILLDTTGWILFANRKAELLLRQRGNPTVMNGRLCGLGTHENSAIKHALHQAEAGIGSTLKLDNTMSIGTRILTFSPIMPAHGEYLGTLARIIVMIAEPDKAIPGDLSAFAQLYKLTPAETRVLTYLLQQQSTHEIAEMLHVSMATLRTQLRALFSKTRTKNQRELVRFCLLHPKIEKT